MVVGIFYKWEDHNHGLEHKCGTCATVLSSPRAKKTCFGVHEEVCPAYHKTLHFVGASHKCAACSNATKAHNKRHLEIAELIQAIHRLEGSSSTNSPLRNNKRKGKQTDDSNFNPSDDGSGYLAGIDQEREVQWENDSSTLNNDDDAEERKKCLAGAMESPDARRAAKAERKAAKNQVLFDIVTQEELGLVERALHPDLGQDANPPSKGQGLANNRTIDENIAFNANVFKWGKWGKLRQSIHAKKIAKNNGGKPKPNTPEQDNKILSPIFAQLGISIHVKANRERKSLDSRLRAAILGDLVAYENDQVETMQRMAGYWRYANRHTYNEMVRNNEIWDWATGEKLPEMEAELDVIEEEDESAEAGTRVTKMESRIPENWDDPDFELPGGETVLSLNPLVDGSNANEKVDRSNPRTKPWHPDGDTKVDEGYSITDRIINSKLSFSPGCLSGQTLSVEVPSPLSIDEIWERRLQADFGDSETLDQISTPRDPLSPKTPNPNLPLDEGFQGVKDTRVFAKAIRKASPLLPTAPIPPQPTHPPSLPAAKKQRVPDPLNRFGALDHEVPAPCEEFKKADPPTPVKSTVKIPAKPIVKTLAIHDEQDDWTTMRRLKGKKGGKGGAVVALRETAAGNVQARKFAGGKSFAAAVRRGV